MKTAIILLALASTGLTTSAGTSTINATNSYGWGANIGWLNWRPDPDGMNDTGVRIEEFICSGWIWSGNVGWINVGNGFTPSNGHVQYSNATATDFGLNYSIDPQQPGYGILRGFAYGANIGWINFNDLNGKVQTDHIAKGVDSNGNGIADAWEYLYYGGLLAPGAQNTYPNGSSMTLLQYYQDGFNPLVPNSGLRVTGFSTNQGGAASAITFTSTTSRLYSIEVTSDLIPPVTWTDSGLGHVRARSGIEHYSQCHSVQRREEVLPRQDE